MTFPVAFALILGITGAVLAVTWLAPTAVFLSALGCYLAFRIRQRHKFMNESLRLPTIALALNLLSLTVGGVAVSQFAATWWWIDDIKPPPPQIYEFQKTLKKALAPLPDLGSK
jgi:hypothetical protein